MEQVSKILIRFVAAVLVICFVLVLLWGITSMKEKVTVISENDNIEKETDAMESFRTLRQQLRAMQKAQLNDVAHDSDADPELSEMAQRQLLRLCEREEKEMILEGLMKMQGWKNALVSVSEDTVNVMIRSEVITQKESSVILDMVCRETGIQSGNVKIIPIN